MKKKEDGRENVCYNIVWRASIIEYMAAMKIKKEERG